MDKTSLKGKIHNLKVVLRRPKESADVVLQIVNEIISQCEDIGREDSRKKVLDHLGLIRTDAIEIKNRLSNPISSDQKKKLYKEFLDIQKSMIFPLKKVAEILEKEDKDVGL